MEFNDKERLKRHDRKAHLGTKKSSAAHGSSGSSDNLTPDVLHEAPDSDGSYKNNYNDNTASYHHSTSINPRWEPNPLGQYVSDVTNQ